MKRLLIVFLGMSLVAGGCVMRVYKKEVPRTDIEIAGNQGYLIGGSSVVSPKPVKTTRQILVTEVELGVSPQSGPASMDEAQSSSQAQSSGELVLSDKQEAQNEDVVVDTTPEAGAEMKNAEEESVGGAESMPAPEYQEYTVRKGDTLQKISYKFYGKYGLWKKIYEANKGALKSPDSISVGQVIKVPVLSDE